MVLGGIAQLGERLHGMQEVSSSILLTSTNIFENGLVQGFDPIVSRPRTLPFHGRYRGSNPRGVAMFLAQAETAQVGNSRPERAGDLA